MTDFRESWHSEVLLLFSLFISIVLFLWYKPPFIFSCIVSNKCRYSNENPHHYQMKYKKRHSFHGYTLFIRRPEFHSGRFMRNCNLCKKKVFPVFSGNVFINLYRFGKCFNAFQYNLWAVFYNTCNQYCQFNHYKECKIVPNI